MALKNSLLPVQIPFGASLTGDMSGDLTSNTTNIQFQDNVSIQLNFTGTPTGAFSVQGSLDNTNWTTLTMTPSPVASGSAATILIEMNQLSFPYIRTIYTRTSGTGTLTMFLAAKAV